MAHGVVQLTRRRAGETMRRDAWWLPPLGAFVVLTAMNPLINTAHVVNGALVLGASLVVALRAYRFSGSRVLGFSGSPVGGFNEAEARP